MRVILKAAAVLGALAMASQAFTPDPSRAVMALGFLVLVGALLVLSDTQETQ